MRVVQPVRTWPDGVQLLLPPRCGMMRSEIAEVSQDVHPKEALSVTSPPWSGKVLPNWDAPELMSTGKDTEEVPQTRVSSLADMEPKVYVVATFQTWEDAAVVRS